MARLVDQVLAVDHGLDAAGVSHAFGGALALAYCIDTPRATADIDVNVFVAPEQADTVFAALPAAVRVRAEDRRTTRRDGQVRLWWDTTPVDLFFAYHELHLHAATRIRRVPLAGTDIPVLACTDLAVFKAFFSRTRDWADLEAMAAAGSVDVAEALSWMDELLGRDHQATHRLREILLHPAPNPPVPRLPTPPGRRPAPRRSRRGPSEGRGLR